ncbi:MAG TPA: sulfotransferase [Chthoniobacteraceae bacterium]|jgi:hypothetical protein|nr:sulfotransferase [Chthoniobacteraceae bacterium]
MGLASDTPDRHSAFLHPFLSAGLGSLIACFREYGWPDAAYWPRTASLFLVSALRTLFHRSNARAVSTAPIPPPVFIVGHWRSGTTHLHQLLSRDPQFGYVTFLQAASPHDFRSPVISRFFAALLPPRRPMDAVRIAPDSPMEEEMALACLSSLSFYHGFFFPRAARRIYRESVHFDGVAPADVERWWHQYRNFLENVQATRPGKRLLLKNPANSARVTRLRHEFPGAKFIHLHRHPEKVFASSLFLHRKLREAWALQTANASELPATVMANYTDLMRALEAESNRAPKNEWIDVALADLENEPLTTLRTIYRQLELPGFNNAAPFFAGSIAEAAAFRKNDLWLDAGERVSLRAALAPIYERWGYA